MADSLGQPGVVENRAGAILAAEAVLKSPADGHTLFLGALAEAGVPGYGFSISVGYLGNERRESVQE